MNPLEVLYLPKSWRQRRREPARFLLRETGMTLGFAVVEDGDSSAPPWGLWAVLAVMADDFNAQLVANPERVPEIEARARLLRAEMEEGEIA